MFATKGRLTATICLVVFLVAGLGMYEAFRPKQAEADCSTVGRIHKSFSYQTYVSSGYTGEEDSAKTNCSRCPGYPASIHKLKRWGYTYDDLRLWNHRWLWDSSFDYCHSHSLRITTLSWHLIRCNKSSDDDN